MIRCKDFHIIKVRYYADEKVLDKYYKNGSQGPYPRQHFDRAESYHNFQRALIKHVTGQDNMDLFNKYQFNTLKAGMEDVQEATGIRYISGEGWDTYMIPKDKTELIEWIEGNLVSNPFKVLKVIRLGFINYVEFPPTFWREYSIKNKIDLTKFK